MCPSDNRQPWDSTFIPTSPRSRRFGEGLLPFHDCCKMPSLYNYCPNKKAHDMLTTAKWIGTIFHVFRSSILLVQLNVRHPIHSHHTPLTIVQIVALIGCDAKTPYGYNSETGKIMGHITQNINECTILAFSIPSVIGSVFLCTAASPSAYLTS